MGEIATWSAVKTKVGLGKDSNECPTKAELLALSPTGTGENYVGLEISNASSYGNNETVQLSDIHKVTYKYVFTVEHPTLSFTALGGVPTPSSANIASTREKILDGVATGTIEWVNYSYPALPDWLTLIVDLGYRASENTNLSARTFAHTLTQQGSGKQLTITCNQVAATQTFEYVFSSQTTQITSDALGGVSDLIFDITSYKQEYRNGKIYGSPIIVNFDRSNLPSWVSNVDSKWVFSENKSLSTRSESITFTQAESGKKITATFTQAAGVKTYGTPTVYLGTIADIPASGGTAATPTYTYTQLWGWNGKTSDGGTINSGASVVWSENVSGSNLGTTAKARTKLGSRTLTVTLNGKSGSASIDVYQAQNQIESTTQGAWVVSISANPSTFTEQGGTSQISASARAPRTNTWSSGATNAASDATGTPTLSIPTASTGFSLSGTTLTVAENKTANQRSVVVRATMDTVYKEVTVTQSTYLVEWEYTFTASPTTLSFDALGTAKSITITSYREKYINGSLVEGSRENVSYIHATSTEHIGTVLGTSISMQENQTTSTRSGQVSYEQNGSNKVIRITCSQAAGTISTRYEISWTANYSNGTVEENVTEVELEGTTGRENSVRMDLHILEYTSINGVEGTPTSWDSRAIAENNSTIALPSGQVSATLQSDSENAFIGITNSVQNLAEYPRTHTITLYNPKVVINGKEVGTVPTITLLVNPIPYTRGFFEFGWKQKGSTITNITLEGDISNGSSAGSRDIISYVSLRRNNVEFTKKYVKPTFIPPSEDWLQVIDNGQKSDNSYNWVFRALTNNEGDSARNQQVRFEQPGNGNQALYAYVSQDPRDEGYLGGRVNNNGPRIIRLDTLKDENLVGRIDIQSGNYYGLGTLAQDAITIGTTISVGGTDSSTYTQQVELSNLKFSKSGRPVTISNDPNQTTDYEYYWELYPSAFTVNISMLSSDGDNDNGIRLDIIKENTTVFPIGTLIGILTLTPKDPTKLPIITCDVYHRYFN